MNNPTYTIDKIMDLNPCDNYSRSHVEELWSGRESLSLLEILHLNIPDADKIWMITRSYQPDWLEVVVTRAVRSHAVGTVMDEWAKKWLSGEDRSVESAQAATWAAEAARHAAAYGAAHAAAYSAVWAAEVTPDVTAEAAEAAWTATIAATEATSWGAEADACADAEQKQQVSDAIAMLEAVASCPDFVAKEISHE